MLGLDIIFGGLTGLIGNVVTGITNYKTKKLEFEHEVLMVKAESEAMKLEAEMNIAVTKAEIEGEIELADSAAYIESLKAGQKDFFGKEWIDKLFNVQGKFLGPIAAVVGIFVAGGFGFVDWLRGFMRPALTAYLVGLSTVITFMVFNLLQGLKMDPVTPTEAADLFSQVVSIIIYLTVSCVTWWFGDRTMSKYITKRFDKKK